MDTLPEGYISAEVTVGLDEAIDLDLEDFLDLISERAGHPILMDVGWTVTGVTAEGTLTLTVTGQTDEDYDDGE